MIRRRGSKFAVSVATLGLAVAWLGPGCGTDPVGVEACKKVEQVRCESARACDIDLSRPVHIGTSPEAEVAACIRYYDDACMHGILARDQGEPAPTSVDACVDAIINGDCEVVRRPESHPACAWLVPPTPPPNPPPAPPNDAAADG